MAWTPLIDEEKAIALARRHAEERGWAWSDPAVTWLYKRWFKSEGRWEIMSNGYNLGAKVKVVLDANTGEILESWYVPR